MPLFCFVEQRGEDINRETDVKEISKCLCSLYLLLRCNLGWEEVTPKIHILACISVFQGAAPSSEGGGFGNDSKYV